MHERTPWNQGGPAPRDIRWPSGSVSATIPEVSDEIASREAMNLESQLWREVSEHLELGESIRRIAAVLSEHLPLDLLLVRRLEQDPLRLTTVASSVPRQTEGEAPWPPRTDVEPELARELGAWLRTRGIALVSERHPLSGLLRPKESSGEGVAFPLIVHGQTVGVAVAIVEPGFEVEPRHLHLLSSAARPLSVAFENDQRIHELTRMRSALEADRDALLSRLQRTGVKDVVIGESKGLKAVMDRAKQVAPTDAPVLILGETGSGKEVIARAIHAHSRRARGPVVRVNCGAIPSELIDSELFGHERGAFTGANAQRKGWFERADGGTLFLDEIGELPLAAQVRLLRVLQDGTLERVGGHQTISVDVRIVAATHRQLETMVQSGAFREDLWYRLSVFPLRLPSLRERPEDLKDLAEYFADAAGKRLGGHGLRPTDEDIELLSRYSWPGNVRELGAVIERAAILGNGKHLEIFAALGSIGSAPSRPSSPPPPLTGEAPMKAPPATSGRFPTLDEAMAAHIEAALERSFGRIEGPHGAARLLGINPHTLRARMRKLRIDWGKFRSGAG